MDTSYQDEISAIKYLDFLNSKNGEIQKHVLYQAVRSRLEPKHNVNILDAGCGPGWLTHMLKKDFSNIQACDPSDFLIQFAKVTYHGVDFKVASLNKPMPYAEHSFDAAVLNMVGPDLANLKTAFKNLSTVIKPAGKLIVTVPHPTYSYPAAEWKREPIDFLLFRKPKLILKNPPFGGTVISREFGSSGKIHSHYYTLHNYTTAATEAGLKLVFNEEIKSAQDSPEFDLIYQLYRYPLFLLLEFVKP